MCTFAVQKARLESGHSPSPQVVVSIDVACNMPYKVFSAVLSVQRAL